MNFSTKALQHVLKVTSIGGHIAVTDERVVPLDAKLRRSEGRTFELSFEGGMFDNKASELRLSKVGRTSSQITQITKIFARDKPVASMLHFSHAGPGAFVPEGEVRGHSPLQKLVLRPGCAPSRSMWRTWA